MMPVISNITNITNTTYNNLETVKPFPVYQLHSPYISTQSPLNLTALTNREMNTSNNSTLVLAPVKTKKKVITHN